MKTFLHFSRQVTDDICPECWTSKKEARNVLKMLLEGGIVRFRKQLVLFVPKRLVLDNWDEFNRPN